MDDAPHARAFLARGQVYLRRGELDRALTAFLPALDLHPAARTARQEFAQALEDYAEAIRCQPQFARAYHYRGLTHARLGDAEAAVRDFSTALRLDPTEADCFFHRGRAFAELEEYDKALADFGHALRLDPEHAGAFHLRGIVPAQH